MEINKRTCKRCKHKWVLRKPVEPVICPKCKSPYWNRKVITKPIQVKKHQPYCTDGLEKVRFNTCICK